jgi:hypothetical protein
VQKRFSCGGAFRVFFVFYTKGVFAGKACLHEEHFYTKNGLIAYEAQDEHTTHREKCSQSRDPRSDIDKSHACPALSSSSE